MATRPQGTWVAMMIGQQLRRLRERQGLSVDGLEVRPVGSRQKIWRMEAGRGPYRVPDLEMLLRLYRATPVERQQLLDLAARPDSAGWWESFSTALPPAFSSYIALEDQAEMITVVNEELINGLLQTEAYHRAVINIDPDVPSGSSPDEQVQLRATRQARTLGRDLPLNFLMSEASLRHGIGGAGVMTEQMAHLARLVERPKTSIRVLPLNRGGHAALKGAFTLLWMPESSTPVAYSESLDGGRVIAEPSATGKFEEAARLCLDRSIDIREFQP